jgi:hypothetical protein
MNVTRDAISALQGHFLGRLSAPARTWLEVLPPVGLVVTSAALRHGGEGSALDFGSVASPGEERHCVRIASRAPERIDVRLADTPEWMAVRWRGIEGDLACCTPDGSPATLDIVVRHDINAVLGGSIRLLIAGATSGTELPVRMTARRSHPLGEFDFNGSPLPCPFDFGFGRTPFVLSVRSAMSEPLVVRFADLPEWLTFEAGGRERRGPLEGVFFERSAPVTISLKASQVGHHKGSVRLLTNDPRPEWQSVELRFTARIQTAKPCVRAVSPQPFRIHGDENVVLGAELENWGSLPASLSASAIPAPLEITAVPPVPAARAGEPGRVVLPIRVHAARLDPGAQLLRVPLRIEGGEPPEVDVLIRLEVAAAPKQNKPMRPELVAALFALLLLTLLYVFLLRGTA